jgi:hypothetical protein
MKIAKMLIMLLIVLILINGCGPAEPEENLETVSEAAHAGIYIEVVQALYLGDQLQIEFFIEQETETLNPLYRIRMPWIVTDSIGNRYESTHSAFHNVLNTEGDPQPGSHRLVVTFNDIPLSVAFVDIEAFIEPSFLVQDENDYLFEALLTNLPVSGEDSIEIQKLGFTITGTADRQEDESLSVTIRIVASEELLASLIYPVQTEGKDSHGQLYISNRSQRGTQRNGRREETLFFQDVASDISFFTVRYPIHVKATLPEKIPFLFTHIPIITE